MDRIAVVGIGQTRYEKRKKDETFADMVFEACSKALADAGVSITDIDNVLSISNDFWDGRTISSMAVQDAAGVRHKNTSCVEGDGVFGAIYGMARTMSGSYDTTMVVAHHKGSESKMHLITNAMFDPIYQRSLGIDYVSSAALQANAYMERYGITEEQLAKVSVKNHGNAQFNPLAQLPLEISIKDVLESPQIAEPLKRLDCSPTSDGACAIILSNERGLKRFKTRPIWIKGVAYCSDSYFLGERDLATSPALQKAAEDAYRMAGIKDPKKEIQVAEVADVFSYMELMWYEGLGFCRPGEGGKLVDSEASQLGGEIPVNPSGGILAGRPPVYVAGLAAIAEIVLQLRGEAGQRQVKNARVGLAHGINGPCAQSHAVMILGN
ncbi:MAG: thiolase family protein [Chloroflexota bacterium]